MRRDAQRAAFEKKLVANASLVLAAWCALPDRKNIRSELGMILFVDALPIRSIRSENVTPPFNTLPVIGVSAPRAEWP